MDYRGYAEFLPAEFRDRITVGPESTWWNWRDMNVHVARARRPESPVRVLALHGGGGHSALVWPLASLVADEGVDVAAIDLPLYGRTEVPRRSAVRYHDWIDLLCDFATAEDDGRPLVVFGASMGGMLGYELAARSGSVSMVIATCLLDPSDPAARAAASRFSWMGRSAPVTLRAMSTVAGGLSVPISWMADTAAMSRNPALSRACMDDPLGAGVRVPIGWLSSYMNYSHAAPESFTDTPVLLVHPAADSWTPPELSLRFLDRVAAPTRDVMLENCGHFPAEQPGLDQLETALREAVDLELR
ncbi:hypothetical protein GOARA_021_00410 [Gordonia araii NBRC 100433]|uniref:AB hydrolase-1 domain-containing protein n=1 Tax=Gordonia araii NBRC 100433 TaxID=1073574 RepID=G7GYX9_9ACTN|nr:alpha/beta hydrolase [Gordonia araii]NNG97014.1 alpha/beta hydrolase [Gordonia araii NBRC 100433]GAB08804.1 hypothetical protein GOARA_021_00410 [Gordonia araii NBRC 100433]